MTKLEKLLAGVSMLALVGLVPQVAEAQSPPAGTVGVQHSAQHADAATFLIGQANGATSCNTVSQTAASDTITIPAVAGQFIYITEFYMGNATDATGVTQTGTVSTTNIATAGAAPFWTFASALTTVQGIAPVTVDIFPNGLKSAAPGTAVTFVPSATQSAHNFLCMHVAGYYGP